jgi:opacity protein-like surface antigen
MRSIVKRVTALALAVVFCSSAFAQGFNPNNLFFGAGLSSNDANGSDDGTGFQLFGGYTFGVVAPNVRIDAEVGYMDSGDLSDALPGDQDATGLWAAAVGRLTLNPQVELLGRVGFDFGDDDGLLVGVGAGLHLNKQSTLRFEIVERDSISSLQLNFVYRP